MIHAHPDPAGGEDVICGCSMPDVALDQTIPVPRALVERLLVYLEGTGEDHLHGELWDCVINVVKKPKSRSRRRSPASGHTTA